jgi:hypothetical protein
VCSNWCYRNFMAMNKMKTFRQIFSLGYKQPRCTRWYINITVTVLDNINRRVPYLKHDISEIGFCLRRQISSIYWVHLSRFHLKTQRQSSLWNFVFWIKQYDGKRPVRTFLWGKQDAEHLGTFRREIDVKKRCRKNRKRRGLSILKSVAGSQWVFQNMYWIFAYIERVLQDGWETLISATPAVLKKLKLC